MQTLSTSIEIVDVVNIAIYMYIQVSSAPVLSAAKESSKQEECLAICQLRGVDATAPLSLQLKAIDQEYHHLIESGQSAKADHVMTLFAWKNKQATQV